MQTETSIMNSSMVHYGMCAAGMIRCLNRSRLESSSGYFGNKVIGDARVPGDLAK